MRRSVSLAFAMNQEAAKTLLFARRVLLLLLAVLTVLAVLELRVASESVHSDAYSLQTDSLPVDLNFLPTLSNGHLGYTVFGDAIFMNGVYNGRGGDSRRARLPNWMNLSASVEGDQGGKATRQYALHLQDGIFCWSTALTTAGGVQLEERTYAHRFYTRALVYELLVQRADVQKPLNLLVTRNAGNDSSALDFEGVAHADYKVLKGVTRVVEQAQFQKEPRTVFVVFSEAFEKAKRLTMDVGNKILSYRFVVTVDEEQAVAIQEMEDVLDLGPQQMLQRHVNEWRDFWADFGIDVAVNVELAQIVNAGIFYLASSLPAARTNQPERSYFGLSPTGLGRGQLDADYEGHNFWDTEIWMLPVVQLMSDKWARTLLQYRLDHLAGAQFNANATGYRGARFPWESAFTGTEVTNPCCPEVAAQQIHISPDIVVALQQLHAATNDGAWLCRTAWPLASAVAAFLESRVSYDATTRRYHVEGVMCPDEDHWNVNDSVYTNVVFKIALEFASYTQRLCSPNETAASGRWLEIAQKLLVLYDPQRDYHPQFAGYKVGEPIKQADVILLGYPLQRPMNASTRRNDLAIYERVTRASGPAMTWSMFAINFLDVNAFAKADAYFERSYSDYVHPDFKVWSETKLGSEGSANFLTGFGGFLQAILNGYGALRLYREDNKSILEIRRTRPLPGSSGFTIHGLNFVQSKFDMLVPASGPATLNCSAAGPVPLELVQSGIRQRISKGFSTTLRPEGARIQTL